MWWDILCFPKEKSVMSRLLGWHLLHFCYFDSGRLSDYHHVFLFSVLFPLPLCKYTPPCHSSSPWSLPLGLVFLSCSFFTFCGYHVVVYSWPLFACASTPIHPSIPSVYRILSTDITLVTIVKVTPHHIASWRTFLLLLLLYLTISLAMSCHVMSR